MPKLHELVDHKGRMRPVGTRIWLRWGDDEKLMCEDIINNIEISKVSLKCDWETEDVGVTITTKQFWDAVNDALHVPNPDGMEGRLWLIAKELGLGSKP